MKIIDSHIHLVQYIAGTGAKGELRYCGGGQARYSDGSICQIIPTEWNTDQVTPERILSIMDTHNVEKAVLLQGGYLGFQNLYSYDAQQNIPPAFSLLRLMIRIAITGMLSFIIYLKNAISK